MNLPFVPFLPKAVLAFMDATLAHWMYEIWPPGCPLPDALEAFMVVRQITEDIWPFLPEDWKQALEEQATAPEVMYQ